MFTKFIESKKYAWAPGTQRSVAKRLKAVGPDLANCNDGAKLYEALKDQLKPYSLKTTFYNVSTYIDWLIETGEAKAPNNIRKFMKDNARLFKNAYIKKELDNDLTLEEARKRINTISDKRVRRDAELLLGCGLRYEESTTLSHGYVVGKGGKRRRVFGVGAQEGRVRSDYQTLYRKLKSVGLTPHMLRKLFATALVRKGVDFKTLMDFMGWSSTETAASYVQSVKEDEMDRIAKELYDGN